ncbi:MAG TPA: response regulator [Chitinophagaceae bacterium]|nr:response regulator [Chitinophagaceae bacterium]
MSVAVKEPTRVLLAEDDDDDFFIFSLAAQELSVRIMLTRAENGDILIKLLDENIPDLLFLDLLMPCKDGRTCIKEIRANAKYDKLPIIVYSSMRDLNNIEFCYREGGNLYVFKPSSLPDLKVILEKILSIDWKNIIYYPPFSGFVMSA